VFRSIPSGEEQLTIFSRHVEVIVGHLLNHVQLLSWLFHVFLLHSLGLCIAICWLLGLFYFFRFTLPLVLSFLNGLRLLLYLLRGCRPLLLGAGGHITWFGRGAKRLRLLRGIIPFNRLSLATLEG
jgi:hypothetical protein